MKPHKNQTITLSFHALGSSGEGIGLYNGFIVFVEGALPGESAKVSITEVHKNYAKAKLLQVLEPSDVRVKPACPVYDLCGGCQIMHLSYEQQLAYKTDKVRDSLKKIGKFTDQAVNPCIASPQPLAYRNKIQLPVLKQGNNAVIGLYQRNSHNLVPIENCLIHCPLGEIVFASIKPLIQKFKGKILHILIKSAVKRNEVLVVLVTDGRQKGLQDLADEIMECPNVKGVVENINRESGNRILGDCYRTLAGQNSIIDNILGLQFKVSPHSFFQVNPWQVENLYKKVIELAEVVENEKVLDAFCGVGTLSLLLAKRGAQVTGVECVEQAIEDAKENARLNGLANAEFICDLTENHIGKMDELDMIILNPPRKGCERSVLETIKRKNCRKVIYVSCDPATLARDLQILCEGGAYRIDLVQPFDMFPQTAHVETVVRLSSSRAVLPDP